jgi:hypothetical protein
MNDDEDESSGNAHLLESYLKLAGICADVYDILTPNDIRDGQLHTGGYDFLWAPHWTGYQKYDVDNDGNGTPDVEDIVSQIKLFLENGNGLFAECASIETFEHSPNGRFLSTKGFGHNGGTQDAKSVIYNDPTAGNAQIADFAFKPGGGHLHNWRPFHSGDNYNRLDPLPDVSGGDSEYVDTVTRFVIDDTGWDYYVGGYAYGDTRNGYVIYLGGHRYAECSGTGETFEAHAQPLIFIFNKNLSNEEFTMVVNYNSGSQTTATFTTSDLTTQAGDPLEVDVTTAFVNKNLLDDVILRNNGESSVDIDSIKLCWTHGVGDQWVTTITNKYSDEVIYDVAGTNDVHEMQFEFTESISDEVITLVVNYDSSSQTTVTFPPFDTNAGDPLLVDITTGGNIQTKKVQKIYFQNTGASSIDVDSITISWTGGAGGQLLKKIENKTINEKIDNINQASPHTQATDGFFIAPPGAGATGCGAGETGGLMEPPYLTTFSVATVGEDTGCGDNSGCSWTNMAGVQLVLNTLFNIKFQITSREYVRSSPIVLHPYLYQGTFEYPSYFGHFRRYNVTETGEDKDDEWDTGSAGKILAANNDNTDGRKVYTAKDNGDGTWTIIAFDDQSIEDLRVPLDVNPLDADDVDELAVITRVRGKYWDNDYDIWVERENKMGGIMHSAPVIVVQNSRSSESESRTEIAYMGDLYGMLHAIDIATGMEKWTFIPPNLLGLLQNDRSDPNAIQDFAAVDGSPTARDVFYDHDNDPGTPKQWRTILVCAEGLGGKYIFALDVTDPDNFSLLWEITDTEMGHAYRTAIGKVKSGEELKWMVFVATGNASIVEEHGGINIFAFDLISGAKLWHFSNDYSDAVNDIPGSITLFDTDDDTFVDRVYVGDMNGRMWELEALDGTNPYGTVQSGDDIGKEIPLWNAGVGNPISVSPAIVRVNPVILIFGTGGTDWAATNQHYYVYAVKAEGRDDPENPPSYAGGAGTLYWDQEIELPLGEKVWSTPTIAAGNIYLATAIGTMESGSPRSDLASSGQDTGTFYSISLDDGSQNWSISNIGKVRGSVFVDKQHAYLTTINNEIIQIGSDTFPADIVNNVVLRAWRQL